MNWVGGIRNRVKDSFSRSRSRSTDRKVQREYFERKRLRAISEPKPTDPITGDEMKTKTTGKHRAVSQDILSFRRHRIFRSDNGARARIRTVNFSTKAMKPGTGRVQTVELPLSPEHGTSELPVTSSLDPTNNTNRLGSLLHPEQKKVPQTSTTTNTNTSSLFNGSIKGHLTVTASRKQPAHLELFGMRMEAPTSRRRGLSSPTWTSSSFSMNEDTRKSKLSQNKVQAVEIAAVNPSAVFQSSEVATSFVSTYSDMQSRRSSSTGSYLSSQSFHPNFSPSGMHHSFDEDSSHDLNATNVPIGKMYRDSKSIHPTQQSFRELCDLEECSSYSSLLTKDPTASPYLGTTQNRWELNVPESSIFDFPTICNTERNQQCELPMIDDCISDADQGLPRRLLFHVDEGNSGNISVSSPFREVPRPDSFCSPTSFFTLPFDTSSIHHGITQTRISNDNNMQLMTQNHNDFFDSPCQNAYDPTEGLERNFSNSVPTFSLAGRNSFPSSVVKPSSYFFSPILSEPNPTFCHANFPILSKSPEKDLCTDQARGSKLNQDKCAVSAVCLNNGHAGIRQGLQNHQDRLVPVMFGGQSPFSGDVPPTQDAPSLVTSCGCLGSTDQCGQTDPPRRRPDARQTMTPWCSMPPCPSLPRQTTRCSQWDTPAPQTSAGATHTSEEWPVPNQENSERGPKVKDQTTVAQTADRDRLSPNLPATTTTTYHTWVAPSSGCKKTPTPTVSLFPPRCSQTPVGREPEQTEPVLPHKNASFQDKNYFSGNNGSSLSNNDKESLPKDSMEGQDRTILHDKKKTDEAKQSQLHPAINERKDEDQGAQSLGNCVFQSCGDAFVSPRNVRGTTFTAKIDQKENRDPMYKAEVSKYGRVSCSTQTTPKLLVDASCGTLLPFKKRAIMKHASHNTDMDEAFVCGAGGKNYSLRSRSNKRDD